MSSDYYLPTDHGYAVVQDMEDGTKKVMVCDSVVGGEAQNVYAIHFKCTSLRVGPGVRMEHVSGGSHTRQVVEVFSEQRGVVDLRAPARGTAPLLEADARRR
ncbi:hypothetical protein HUT06_11790 [Actinomadura sp. NAK00032]|uniref:hypothetical protein n=1 Tax=Actinomadura sp. NAK00032 TaxID=2742128 RepID=UPI0015902370|nr:hypothetical protein [Actinomadura sp. NAK00032]QKW34628.1 hypothetical protein HUT06_11790 [Actinomadura sp. NAK00032]